MVKSKSDFKQKNDITNLQALEIPEKIIQNNGVLQIASLLYLRYIKYKYYRCQKCLFLKILSPSYRNTSLAVRGVPGNFVRVKAVANANIIGAHDYTGLQKL